MSGTISYQAQFLSAEEKKTFQPLRIGYIGKEHEEPTRQLKDCISEVIGKSQQRAAS